MEFDRSRVYTALNADELKPGSKCIFADSLKYLKQYVKDDDYRPMVLDKILDEDFMSRFVTGDNENYLLAYLVSESKKPRRMTNKELARWLAKGNGQLRLRSGDISMYFIYTNDNSYVSENYMIRGWDETEWREPVVEEADE